MKQITVMLMILLLMLQFLLVNSVLPEDVKACVLFQCFSQTSSTLRRDAVGRETEEQRDVQCLHQ